MERHGLALTEAGRHRAGGNFLRIDRGEGRANGAGECVGLHNEGGQGKVGKKDIEFGCSKERKKERKDKEKNKRNKQFQQKTKQNNDNIISVACLGATPLSCIDCCWLL